MVKEDMAAIKNLNLVGGYFGLHLFNRIVAYLYRANTDGI
jgi:hypothetical protein